MKKKAVFLGLVEMGALIGYIFAAVLFGIFLFGVKGCSLVQPDTILQNISGVDLSEIRSDYEVVSMLRMPAGRDLNTADRIAWCIVHDDYLLLENQLNNLYSSSDDYWKLEIYDNDGGKMKELERKDWKPKSGIPYKTATALIPTHYHDTIPFIKVAFTITKGEKD